MNNISNYIYSANCDQINDIKSLIALTPLDLNVFTIYNRMRTPMMLIYHQIKDNQ
jgi:hypothetical protein